MKLLIMLVIVVFLCIFNHDAIKLMDEEKEKTLTMRIIRLFKR